MFGISIARKSPQTTITAMDWEPVLEVARENAGKFGVADRHRTKPGNAFEVDFGSGYDVVLLTNFLHHFDQATCESLLRKTRAALKPDGCAVILEFVPNDDRVSPPPSATFALIMLAETRAGDAYTFRELDSMCRTAGFARTELHTVPPGVQSVVLATP
jgi:2-polyprenyl-3-methyl-5-hydroxy-6-metoxy-1,4-benzoquinol methylase